MYKNITFESGGDKGYAYIGAIQELSERKILDGLEKYSGSSIGALFATLLCIGFNSDEITSLQKTLKLKNIIEKSCCFKKLYNIYKYYGTVSSSLFESSIKEILSIKIKPDISFLELYTKTKKELTIVTSNLNKRKAEYFNYKTQPEAKLIDVLIASMSVPIIFIPKKISTQNQSDFLDPSYNSNVLEDYHVDGALTDGYPIWVFDGKNGKISKQTIGLKLLVPDEKNDKEVFSGRVDIFNIEQYISEIINTLMLQIEKSEITRSYIKQTIPIHVPDVSFLDTSINDETISTLIEIGRKSVAEYFNKENESA